MLRVIQWATGTVGMHAIRAIHERPELALVGVRVYSAQKVGVDAGAIAGIGHVGVTATDDVDAIVELDADCVVHAAHGVADPAQSFADVCRLLASGKNVVSTAASGFIYPKAMGDATVERLAAACAAGGTSFHGTGIEPGWASEVLPLTMSGLFRRIESIKVQELLDYSSYGVTGMIVDVMGFGQAPDAPVPIADPTRLAAAFRPPLLLVADALGATIDEVVGSREVVVADSAFEVAAGRIEAGTVSAQRIGATAIVDGHPALTIEHISRLGNDQAPEWPTGRGWRVAIDGAPSMVVEATIGVHDEDENDQGCLATAMHAVNAIAPVCAASPGIKTFLDLPPIIGRGALRPA